LGRAVAAGLAQRFGNGSRRDPFRFQLPPRKYDWNNLPPLPEL